MLRKTFLVILLALFLLPQPAAALAAKAYSADRYDVQIVVQPDGRLDVTETIIFRFEGGPFTYVFRELEYNRLDAIENIRAALDGATLPEGSSAGQVEIEPGRPTRVTWHFADTSDATHEYRLEYTVRGAVRYSDSANEIYWRAIPEEHEYSIDSSTITIVYPPGIAPVGQPRISGAEAGSTQIGDGQAVFPIFGIDADDAVDVHVAFPANSLVSQPPAWQASAEQRSREWRAALPYGLGAALVTGALGLAGLLTLWQRRREEEAVPVSYSSQQQTPPAEISPALAAKLSGSSEAALATLFDLLRRGVLQIELSYGMLRTKQFTLVRLPYNQPLQAHEQGLLRQLFEDRQGWRDRLSFTELGQRLGARQELFNAPLEEELVRRGWLDPERKARRTRVITTGVIAMLLGVVVAGMGLLPFGALLRAILIGAGAALFLVGMAAALIGASGTTLTAAGQQQAEAWRNFSVYLKDITRGREPVERSDLFDTYLPFAAGFGLAAGWAKIFERQQGLQAPEWLASLQASGGNFSDVTAAIIATQSAGSSASSGAAGASGGGASGAG